MRGVQKAQPFGHPLDGRVRRHFRGDQQVHAGTVAAANLETALNSRERRQRYLHERAAAQLTYFEFLRRHSKHCDGTEVESSAEVSARGREQYRVPGAPTAANELTFFRGLS